MDDEDSADVVHESPLLVRTQSILELHKRVTEIDIRIIVPRATAHPSVSCLPIGIAGIQPRYDQIDERLLAEALD